MPYHPLSGGHLSVISDALHQLPDGRWESEWDGKIYTVPREDIYRGIHFLNKNSSFSHHIIVAMDSHVHPQPSFLKEFPNVTIVHSSFVPTSESNPYHRLCAAYRDAIATVPDEEWICYGYTCDLICCKNWDWYIDQARQEYGNEYIYVPMFIERHEKMGTNLDYEIKGTTPTPYQIWVEWRAKVCCHALTWPASDQTYLTEDDFNEYLSIMRRGHEELGLPEVIGEKCGERTIGYYNCLCGKSKYFKDCFVMKGMGFDLEVDNLLYAKHGRIKGVVTRSAVYHPQSEFFTMPFLWKQSRGNG